MRKGLKFTAVALLLLEGAGSVSAGPFGGRNFGGPGMRNARQERMAQQQSDRQAPGVQTDRALVPGGAQGVPSQGIPVPGNAFGGPPEQAPPRRMGQRMTAEERRALRRQINEAGHDIYLPKK